MNIDTEVLTHLRNEYHGVLSETEILEHYKRYVDFAQAKELISRFEIVRNRPTNLLDIGCGYGSFVIEARNAGIKARGIDNSEFEISFAQSRLKSTPLDSTAPLEVFIKGDAATLMVQHSQFDAITAWNVLEHVEDRRSLLKQIYRSLNSGGYFHFICPNYASFRKEAHYRVMWIPYLRKEWAHNYLRARSRNPVFLDHFIYPVYKRTLIRELEEIGFKVSFPLHRIVKLEQPEFIQSRYLRLGEIGRAHV